MKHIVKIFFVLILFIITFQSCTKEQYLTNGGRVQFSTDTVLFDTVWTAQKTSTHIIKLYNKENQKIKTDIFLRKNTESPFDINVNGVAAKQVNGVELAARDSVLIFITMKVNPNDESIPFVVEDELVAKLNGNETSIPIIAYAQNAYYIKDSVLTTSTLLTDKPYVIINSALVKEDNTLTIPAGARIYMHRNSRLFVSGTLKVNGTLEQPVTFQGDRIDRKIYVGDTMGVPGEWGGLYFTETSKENVINYAIIKNGGLSTKIGDQSTIGAMIQVDKDKIMGATPKLYIANTEIHNSIQYGIVAFESSIVAENCLVTECQSEALLLLQGGKYYFDDCTIGNWGRTRFNRRQPNSTSVVIQNYYSTSTTTYVGSSMLSSFKNCIIYGSYDNELVATSKPDYSFGASFTNCIIKSIESLPSIVTTTNCIFNQDPKFKDMANIIYAVSEGSPAIGNGITTGSLPTDIKGKTRANPPTIGAYEY